MTSTPPQTTTPSKDKRVHCVREHCIADPGDAYHFEPHLCFVCGVQWDVTPELLETNLCPDCNWIKCPECGGCRCSLIPTSQKWLDSVRETYCQSVEALAAFRAEDLPNSDPWPACLLRGLVLRGMTLQLMFCKRWARVELAKN